MTSLLSGPGLRSAARIPVAWWLQHPKACPYGYISCMDNPPIYSLTSSRPLTYSPSDLATDQLCGFCSLASNRPLTSASSYLASSQLVRSSPSSLAFCELKSSSPSNLNPSGNWPLDSLLPGLKATTVRDSCDLWPALRPPVIFEQSLLSSLSASGHTLPRWPQAWRPTSGKYEVWIQSNANVLIKW